MRYALASLGLLIAAVPAVAEPKSDGMFKTLIGTLVRARCHMNECEWFSIESAVREKESDDAVLLKVKQKSWVSSHPDGDYDRRRPLKAQGDYTGYVLCSKHHPSIIDRSDDGTWNQTALSPGDPGHSGGANETATAVYWAACQGMKVDNIDHAASQAVHLGYAAHIAGDPTPPVTLSKPSDALAKSIN